MATTRITGKNLDVTFNAVALETDFRSFEASEEQGTVDLTAGDDPAASYGLTFKDGSASFTGLYESTGYIAAWAAVAVGTESDLVWKPEGAGAGDPVYTVNAIVISRSQSIPFDGAVELSVEFQFSDEVVDVAVGA